MYKLLAVGTDAEVFLVNAQDDPVPSIGLFPGTKQNPTTIEALGSGFTLHEDNVMPEFGVPPATNADDFVNNISRMLEYVGNQAGQKQLRVAVTPSQFFLPSQLMHPQAQEIGCDPDWCVWTRKKNKIDYGNELLKSMRTAAAHLHVSFTYKNRLPEVVEMEPVIKLFDLMFLPFLFLDRNTMRRQLYGKAGACRWVDYPDGSRGVEYRVLSNRWIGSDILTRYIYNQVLSTFSRLDAFASHISSFQENVQIAINRPDLELAKNLIKDYQVPLPPGFKIPRETSV